MYKIRLIIIAFIFFNTLKAQELIKINGFIVDSLNEKSLISAPVSVEGTKNGVLTNQSGWFSIDLNKSDVIKVSYLGYKTKRITVRELLSKKLPVKIKLVEQPIVSNEVLVESDVRSEKALTTVGYQQLSAMEIKYSPSFGGESDITKTLQLLPGVVTTNEGSAKFNVRGGENSQNLILIDGNNIYNPMHMLGYVSSFNTDAINNVELYKGYIPPEYSGKISSVLNIDLKEGNKNAFEYSGGVSLISAQLMFEGPIANNLTCMLSARRTYFDPIFKMANINGANYYFYDLYGKLTYDISESDKLVLSGYLGNDKFKFDDESSTDEKGSDKWGNDVLQAKYNHLWSTNLFSDISISYSRFYSELDWNNNKKNPFISDFTVKLNTDYNYSNSLSFKTGGNLRYARFSVSSEITDIYNTELHKLNTMDLNLYSSAKWKINETMNTDIGFSSTFFRETETNKNYFFIEPRLCFCYLFDSDFSGKVSYIHMHQNIHYLTPYTIELPNDVLYPSNKYIPPSEGNQTSIGVTKIVKLFDSKFETSIDAYYNDMWNIVNFKDHFLDADPKSLNDQIIFGKGWSYGVEFQIAKNQGEITGWLNYTWNKTYRVFNNKNKNRAYAPRFFREHQINLYVNYDISKKIKMSSTFVLSSGQPYTLPTQSYYVNNWFYLGYDEINKERFPLYNRLDLSIVYFFEMWKGNWELFCSAYNILNHKNQTFFYYSANEIKLHTISIGMIPTFGIKFRY